MRKTNTRGPSRYWVAGIAFLVVLCTARGVAAEPTRGWNLEAMPGLRGGGGAFVADVRAYAGAARSLSRLSANWGMFAGGGLHFAVGNTSFDESPIVRRWALGPEFRTGFQWGPGRSPKLYLYLAAAPIYVKAGNGDPNIVETEGAFGARVAVGLGGPGSFALYFSSDDTREEGEGNMILALCTLLINSIEIHYEELHAGGVVSRRAGAGLGWSF